MRYAHIVGWGKSLPQRVMTNHEISSMVDTSHEWIYTRTGIHERRIAGAKETTATLAFDAAVRALSVANMHPAELDLIIVATSTSESVFPSTACQIQDFLGAKNAGAFDLSAACSGFVYALSMGHGAIASGIANNALIIGSETMSRVLDWNDRGTCILFGDGAGAVLLEGTSVPGGVMASTLRSDGSGGDLLRLPAVYHNPVPTLGPEFTQNGYHRNTIRMNGRQVFRFATRVIADSILAVLEQAELTMADVALIIPHQANTRIIETAAKRLKIEPQRFYMDVDRVGNTSAASIPIALCEAVEEGRLKPGDNIVFVGFGGGLTWGASVVKWGVSMPLQAPPKRRFREFRYFMARVRSRLRRIGRRLYSYLAGPVFPDASMRDADKKKD